MERPLVASLSSANSAENAVADERKIMRFES
jgi:hypothetical protein